MACPALCGQGLCSCFPWFGTDVDGVCFFGPSAQAQGRGGHVHRDMAPVIRCNCACATTESRISMSEPQPSQPPQPPPGSNRLRCPFFCVSSCWSNPRGRPVAARDGADGGTGSARRRRERRLRSTPSTRWAPLVAFYGTRRQPPGPGTGKSTRRTARLRSGRLLTQLGASQHLCLRLLAGRCLWCGASWRTWDLSARSCRFLDLPVPQMVDYVADVLRILDRPMAQQVIEVLAHHVLLVPLFLSRS